MMLILCIALLQTITQETPSFEFISTESGLSNNVVYDVFEDSEGFIWVATDNGLNRYDGYEFKTFYHDSGDSTTISNNIIRSITEDINGNLWFGTYNGLNQYHRDTETFTYHEIIHQDSTGQWDLQVQYMYKDKGEKIWFNTLDIGGWFDTKTHEYGFINLNYSPFSIALDSDDRIWMLSNDGTFDEFLVEDEKVKSLIENSQLKKKNLYWGEYSKSLWVPKPAGAIEADISLSIIPDLPGNVTPRKLKEVDENTLWIGTDSGLFIYQLESGSLTKIDFKENTSTLTESIRTIYQDVQGGIWVGTVGGVFHYDPHQKDFKNAHLTQESSDVVMGTGLSKGQLYVNSLGKGLFKYDSGKNEFDQLSFKPKPPVGYNFIWDFEEVPESEFPIWLATDAGLLLYNPDTKHWKNAKLPLLKDNTAVSFSILSCEGKFIWVSSVRGIHKLSKETGEIVKSFPKLNEVGGSNIQDLHAINDNIYIASEGGGLLVYNQQNERLQRVSDLNDKASVISSIPIWDIYATQDILWLGTNRGLYQFNTSDLSFEQISHNDQFDNRIIYSIIQDDNGLLWMGTERGLVSYNTENKVISYYDSHDGIINVEFNRKSVIKTSDGKLWFGGTNGLTNFDPNKIQSNQVVPPVHITNLEVITSDSTFTPIYRSKSKLKLPWYHNTIELSYVALNYTNSSQNQYRHQLIGYDPNWVQDRGTHQARYVQLPPGEYTFTVQGSNNDGVWNREGASVIIEILPPFWSTWWFQVAILLVIGFVLWSIYRYRVRKLLEVERMKLRIAGDLHDEVGSGLSGIALTGDLLQRQVNNGGAKPELVSRITNNARNLASSLDTIVWLIDPKKERLEDLLIKIRTVAQELLPKIKLEIREELSIQEKGRVLDSDQKRNLLLLLKESIHNIAKHANADHVKINFSTSGNLFILKVIDDGKGFIAEDNFDGHGLRSMKNRADALNAQLLVHSVLDGGTEIEVMMKLP